jgi:uncharacterized small protein (DUF1192 family)
MSQLGVARVDTRVATLARLAARIDTRVAILATQVARLAT